jgi:hypothetical protein
MTLAACGSPQASHVETPPDEPHTVMAGDDDLKPSYTKSELEKALIAERGAEATNERRVTDSEAKGDDEGLRLATADLGVRRRFIIMLETCQQSGHLCPPRLDDPGTTLDPNPRFDLADWQKLAADLHGRACACRTLACLDTLDDAIDQLEPRPIEDVRGDEQASAELTRARECLFRLRGKAVAKISVPAPLE